MREVVFYHKVVKVELINKCQYKNQCREFKFD